MKLPLNLTERGKIGMALRFSRKDKFASIKGSVQYRPHLDLSYMTRLAKTYIIPMYCNSRHRARVREVGKL